MSTERGRWALDALGEELLRAEATAPPPGPVRPAVRLAAVVAVGMLVAFIALTPPGRAIAEDVAELVGIGDEPSADRESQAAPVVATDDEVVVATGTTPSGERYEMSAFHGTRPAAEQAQLERMEDRIREVEGARPNTPSILDPDSGTCFALDFPDAAQPYGTSSCTLGEMGVGITRPAFNEARHAHPESAIQMEAMTGGSIERVEVTFENERGDTVAAAVAFGRLTKELAERIGAPGPMGHFVAFLPARLFPSFDAPAMGTLEVTGYGAEGAVFEHLDYGPIYEAIHRRNLEVKCLERKLEPISNLKPGERVPADAPTLPEAQRACRR